MIKDNLKLNETIKPNSNEIEKLKVNFPQFFDKDGNFLEDRLKEVLKQNDINLIKEGYELKFLGKSYARYLSSTKTETFVVPHVEENAKEENKESENLYIIGDNLDALKHLLGSYSGKIKCIYIEIIILFLIPFIKTKTPITASFQKYHLQFNSFIKVVLNKLRLFYLGDALIFEGFKICNSAII